MSGTALLPLQGLTQPSRGPSEVGVRVLSLQMRKLRQGGLNRVNQSQDPRSLVPLNSMILVKLECVSSLRLEFT